ncbi:MAG TPA: isoprenylcysteine carboxylmethyltransferase family protein, partial [Myxococcota bacterium]
LVSLFGMAVRAYTVGFAPKRTSGRNTRKGQVADFLNTQGAYSLVRHPLYFANFFVALGAVLFLRAGWLVLVYAVAYWLYYERIMYAEEEFLREKFGDPYVEWAEKTPLFVPAFGTWHPPAGRSFSWRTALKREYQTLFYLILFFAGMKLAADAVVAGRLVLDPVWVGVFSVSLVFFVVVRFVRKRTRLLDVEGR